MEPIFLCYTYSEGKGKIEAPCNNEDCSKLKPNGFCRLSTIILTLKLNKGLEDLGLVCSKFVRKEKKHG